MDRFVHRSERNVPSLNVSVRLGGYLKSSSTRSYAPDSHVIRNLPLFYIPMALKQICILNFVLSPLLSYYLGCDHS